MLGASSAIGSQLALEFSFGNALVLVGRNVERLERSGRACSQKGATSVTLLTADLESGYPEIVQAAKLGNVDLVINAASATSRLRDNALDIDSLGAYVAADLVAPVRLIQDLSKERGPAPLAVIFVSSLLALVRSPNRSVYGGLKSAHELFLKRILESQPARKLLIVRVAVPLPTETVTDRTVNLARAARTAFDRNQSVLFYGLSGRMLSWLYFAQPLAFNMVMELLRKFRGGSN
ncbi:MAG: SDR family NAD(P)-dependent oxidoreductase [Candidatus Solibacter sp.]